MNRKSFKAFHTGASCRVGAGGGGGGDKDRVIRVFYPAGVRFK